jgi:hypothetical protein
MRETFCWAKAMQCDGHMRPVFGANRADTFHLRNTHPHFQGFPATIGESLRHASDMEPAHAAFKPLCLALFHLLLMWQSVMVVRYDGEKD